MDQKIYRQRSVSVAVLEIFDRGTQCGDLGVDLVPELGHHVDHLVEGLLEIILVDEFVGVAHAGRKAVG